MILRYTLEQASLVGKNAAIIMNLIADLETAQSTRQLAGLSGLSDKTVTAALRKLRVVKLLHPEALCLLPFGKECSKSTTVCSKTTTPGEIDAIPQSAYAFGLIEDDSKKGEQGKGDYRGLGLKGVDGSPSIDTSIDTSIGGKEINQSGENLQKSKPIPTLAEVKAYFRDNNQPEKRAVEMFEWFENDRKARGGRTWKDSHGKPVKLWKGKARRVWFVDTPKKSDRYAGLG